MPPGDRWRDVKDGETLESLTEAIQHVFQRAGERLFVIDCGRGEIFTDDGKAEPKEQKAYTMSGEEIRQQLSFWLPLRLPMSKKLDLHGVRHNDVERLVENFVLLNEPPLTIITGNSHRMRQIVINCLMNNDINFKSWGYSQFKILGQLGAF